MFGLTSYKYIFIGSKSLNNNLSLDLGTR